MTLKRLAPLDSENDRSLALNCFTDPRPEMTKKPRADDVEVRLCKRGGKVALWLPAAADKDFLRMIVFPGRRDCVRQEVDRRWYVVQRRGLKLHAGVGRQEEVSMVLKC